MAFLAQNLNFTNDFGLKRHIEYIPRRTGNQKCRPSTVGNHCAICFQFYLTFSTWIVADTFRFTCWVMTAAQGQILEQSFEILCSKEIKKWIDEKRKISVRRRYHIYVEATFCCFLLES